MELAFAALHQLCAPLLDRLDGLPAPQRDALATTFGLSSGVVPDRFFVGLAVLGLLSETSGERPLVCVIDDAQWLDRASAQVLAFVARRMLAEPMVMLFAARDPSDLLAGLPEVVLGGLRGADARSVLASVLPGRLDQRIADELLAETRGNPLALLELPRGLTAAQVAGGFALPGALSLSGRIEKTFLKRLGALPPETQRLLLVAAAEPTGDQALLWRAVERLGISGQAPELAVLAGLIEIDSGVRFRHPLVRSAVYRAAAPEDRRLVHRALAEATDAEIDPERRTWHLAEAAAGPDEEVAGELERVAGQAQARGGLAAAAAFLERATVLTAEPHRHAERALAAAQIKYEAGALDDAVTLLDIAEAGALGDLEGARVHLLRGQIAFAARRGRDAPPLLLQAARELEVVDPDLARDTYLDALAAALFAGRLAPSGAGAVEVSGAARAAALTSRDPRAADLLLDGLALLISDGPSIGAPVLRRSVSAFREEIATEENVRWLWLAGPAARFVWDYEAWDALTRRQIEVARDAGALAVLPLALNARASVYIFAGELSAAASLCQESDALSAAAGAHAVPHSALALDAFSGREDDAMRRIKTCTSDFIAHGDGMGLTLTYWATAVLCNSLTRYEEALEAAEKATDGHELWFSTFAAVELIEAASRAGKAQRAVGALDWITATVRAGGSDWGLGVEARSRALLSDGQAAESLYREAIDRLGRARVRLELARAYLLHGEWLRRERRRRDAREQLRTAFEMFNAMGSEAFAERAERELLATGERVRVRSADTRDELTTQEAQVARLARDGLSNAEIGARMFISQHTVAYHLRKVFSKLDITSRNQLARVLPESASAGHLA
jgi:DNA-binding CsgD family transcriptional regulator